MVAAVKPIAISDVSHGIRAFYCHTRGCRKNPEVRPGSLPIGYSDGTRARLYCGECRKWLDFC